MQQLCKQIPPRPLLFNALSLISVSVDGYPNAITDNYTPRCARVRLCVHVYILAH